MINRNSPGPGPRVRAACPVTHRIRPREPGPIAPGSSRPPRGLRRPLGSHSALVILNERPSTGRPGARYKVISPDRSRIRQHRKCSSSAAAARFTASSRPTLDRFHPLWPRSERSVASDAPGFAADIDSSTSWRIRTLGRNVLVVLGFLLSDHTGLLEVTARRKLDAFRPSAMILGHHLGIAGHSLRGHDQYAHASSGGPGFRFK